MRLPAGCRANIDIVLFIPAMREIAQPHIKRRSFTWIGVCCVAVSVFAILLSIGMPGVGWITAVVALIACSALTPWLNRRYLVGSLAVSTLHLFSFGPLPMLGGEAAIRSWPPAWFLVFLVAFPLMLAVAALFFGRRPAPSVD